MAAVREEFVLVDRFSSTFSQYLRLCRQAASATDMARSEQSGYNDGLREFSGAASQAGEAFTQLGQAVEDAGRSSGQAADEQKKINESFRDGAKAADGLLGKLKGLVTAYLSFQGVRKALDWVGENLELSNIQRNAENQLRAVLANMGAGAVTVPVTAEFRADTAQTMSAFDAIKEKSSEIQGLGIYGDEAMIAGAAELATYFRDPEAVMAMMDTLANYTMGMTGGGAVDKDAMVQYATNIGKIMSGSYIAMTQKGFAFTEAQKAIIEGTATEAQIVSELGEEYLSMSADMQAAAAINAVIEESWGGLYETMSNTPEGKIIQLQNRVGDLREVLGDRLYPAVLQLVDVFNSNFPQIEQVLTGFADVCSVIIIVISWIAEAAINAASVIVEHSDLVLSVLIGIGAAAGVVGAAMIASAMASAAAWLAVNWPLLLIVAAVTAIIQRTLQMGGAWEDVCGTMGSIFYELYAVIYNIVADLWNLFAIFAEFFANVFNDPVTAVANLFADLADWVLSILQSIASGVDAVFGSQLASGVNSWRDGLRDWVHDTFGENEITIARMEHIDYGEAWSRGSELGRQFYQSAQDISNSDMFSFDNDMGLSNISQQLTDIGADTAAIKNAVALSEEDLKMLVDMAEREYVNNINLTAQTPIINVSGQNTGNTDLDRQALADAIRDILLEQSASHTDQAYT